ncbi:MAG TPA: hypothetical protein VGO50_18760 [Pyrinomonadaceae bacterium]|jgi:hypothetical protein|nr:hypothetical protein [Pyrinomonadaceae bacterium]
MQKVGRNFTCCLFIWLAFSPADISAQIDMAKKQEAYQNERRAANLAVMRSNIKQVDDAPQRCTLRIHIIRFIFENKVKNYYDTANSIALECLDETIDNKDQFSESQANRQKSGILSLLRKYSPALAVKVEKKYFTDQGASPIEFWDLDMGVDPNVFATRIISKIATGGVTYETHLVVDKLRELNRSAAYRVLSAVLDYYETHLEAAYVGNTLIFLASEYRDSRTPVELRRRFYNFMVRLGEAALADLENDEPTRLYIDIMKYGLPDMKQVSPELYPKAYAIYTSLSSKRSDSEKEEDEVRERIRASKDKLAQTISEAESATSKSLKNSLWLSASFYALEAKKFRVAADTRLKMDFSTFEIITVGLKDADPKDIFKKGQYSFIKEEVLDGCLKENDIESAQYVIGLVEDPEMKAEGLFKIAAKLVELKKREAAFDTLSEGWKVLEKVETKPSKLWTMQLALPIALKIDKTRAFDMAGDIVKTVNRFPTPGADDKPGTEARQKYAGVLTGVSSNLESVFRLMGKENMALADPISQGIQLKELRLAAQIALETQRVYPLPPEISQTAAPKAQ